LFDLITVNYKSTDFLQTCLTSVYADLNGKAANVYVFDNGSNNHVHHIKKAFPAATLIDNNRNIGFSRAVNRVILQTSAAYIIILNPDVTVYDGFFESISTFMENNPDVGIVGPKVLNLDGSVQGSARSFPKFSSTFFGRKSLLTKLFPNSHIARANILTLSSDGKTPMTVDWISGACMVVRRKALDEVGLLDDNFFLYWEDADWCRRMWQHGWKVIYYPKAAIKHAGGGSSEHNLIRSTFEFHRSAYRLFSKYNRKYNLILKPAVFIGLCIRFCGILSLRLLRRAILINKRRSKIAGGQPRRSR